MAPTYDPKADKALGTKGWLVSPFNFRQDFVEPLRTTFFILLGPRYPNVRMREILLWLWPNEGAHFSLSQQALGDRPSVNLDFRDLQCSFGLVPQQSSPIFRARKLGSTYLAPDEQRAVKETIEDVIRNFSIDIGVDIESALG